MSALAIGLALAAALQTTQLPWRYKLQLDEHSERLSVQVCAPPGVQVPRLVALDRPALEHVQPGPDWQLDSRRWLLSSAGEGPCGQYSVDLGRLADRRQRGHGYRVGADLLTWPDAWLWWPQPAQASAVLQFELPAGWSLSAPWPLLQNEVLPTYRLGGWPRDWTGLVAWGRFEPFELGGAASGVRLAILGDVSSQRQSELSGWVEHLAGLLEPAGGLPLDEAQVLVVPVGGQGERRSGRGPVPWGQVYRAGSGGVHFFVDAEQPIEAYYADWTGAHEFSHLLHPYLGRRGRWLAEGLASYYQNVLRGRSGDLSEQQAWQRLLAGFGRGRRDASNGIALRQVAWEMGNRQAYMRVYWSGAAWWLQRDVELRLLKGEAAGLDRLLARFASAHLPATREWTAAGFAAELDRLAGVSLFAAELEPAEEATRFPELSGLLSRLGLVTDDAGELLRINEAAELAALRQAIMDPGGLAPDRSGRGGAAGP